MPANSERPNLFGLAVIALAGVALVRGCRTDVAPPPEPPAPGVAEITTACDEYEAALRLHIAATIGKLKAGELTTDADTRDWLEVGREAALRAAFGPVAERDQAAFRSGWSVDAQVQRLEDLTQ